MAESKQKPIGARLWLWIAIALMLQACDGTAEVPPAEMPFDPTGTWEASVQGRFMDSTDFVAPMVLRLSLLTEPYSPPGNRYVLVQLAGTWEWAGISGTLDGFWDALEDQTAQNNADCPGAYTVCSLRLKIDPPRTNACADMREGSPTRMWLMGWFDGPTRLAAAELQGTYWQGSRNDGLPCPGPVLISIDEDVVFERK